SGQWAVGSGQWAVGSGQWAVVARSSRLSQIFRLTYFVSLSYNPHMADPAERCALWRPVYRGCSIPAPANILQ
ncbi:MAG: hypothetical protein RL215_383, partial [Planctomycetota bacterium]